MSVVSPSPPQVDKKGARYNTWESGLCYAAKDWSPSGPGLTFWSKDMICYKHEATFDPNLGLLALITSRGPVGEPVPTIATSNNLIQVYLKFAAFFGNLT